MTHNQLEFDPRRALPASAYRDEKWLVAEKDRIWHGDWIFATTEDALREPGDQLPVVIGDQPVLLLRNQSGQLAAVSNLCAHRGTLLVERPAKAEHIQCPYHAWTYDDAGRLLAVPHASEGAIDKTSHCLPVYRVESWHGLVFVSLFTDVESLTSRFAAVEPLVTARGIDALQHHSRIESTDLWECNWKAAICNAMESYHLFKVHSTTLEPYSPTKGAYYIAGSARASATGGAIKGHDDYLLLSLPPSFVGVFTRGSFVWQAVHPMGTHRCAVRIGGAFAANSPQGFLGRLSEWAGKILGGSQYAGPDFLHEDKAICERIQRGFTGNFAPGLLLPVERVVADFGHYLNWRINGIAPPEIYSESK